MSRKKKNTFLKYKLVFFIVATLFAVNFTYQIYKNPLHFLSFVSWPFNKTPHETWHSYSDLFYGAETTRVKAVFLAALSQVESNGNPLAAPDWKFSLTTEPARMYAPASSAFGLMQITLPTFELAQQHCQEEGYYCPHNSLATRLRVRDSLLLTSSFLETKSKELVTDQRWFGLEEKHKNNILSTIHLCGLEVARRLVKSRWNIDSIGQCGSHSLRRYTSNVNEMILKFKKFSDVRENTVAGF